MLKTILNTIQITILSAVLGVITLIPITMVKIHNDKENNINTIIDGINDINKDNFIYVDMELTATTEDFKDFNIIYSYQDYQVGDVPYQYTSNNPYVENIEFDENNNLLNTTAILISEEWLNDLNYEGKVNDVSSFFILPVDIS